jgi:hypothetical protein
LANASELSQNGQDRRSPNQKQLTEPHQIVFILHDRYSLLG